jgi:hypothetical protein
LDGFGHRNHVGGLLFALEDFGRKGLKEHENPVSCTSKLCQWNAPRNLKVEPSTIDALPVRKYHFGKAGTSKRTRTVNLYDPRAQAHRQVDPASLKTLSSSLSQSVTSSCFFLFYDIEPEGKAEELEIERNITDSVPESPIDFDNNQQAFNDVYDISSKQFKEMMDCYARSEAIEIATVVEIEAKTIGQSSNPFWRELKQSKLTASNFHAAAKRCKEPDKLLKVIMYPQELKTKSVMYGHKHEQHAVRDYVKYKYDEGNKGLKVFQVGTILSTEKPGLGASLDRKVYDPKASGSSDGGLEVKCPFSKQGLSLEEACTDKSFFLSISDDEIKLKKAHSYFYQVQGQMYVCNIKWVDFVVWFGPGKIFIERVFFNTEWWYDVALPKIDYFYRRAFLPEVMTRRVQQGINLYKPGTWIPFKNHK